MAEDIEKHGEHDPVVAIHGGAGVMLGHDYSTPAAVMREILVAGGKQLEAGATALDLVVDMVAAMEASGHFIAGKGSAANLDGEVELDAAVMNGQDRQAGAVAAVRNVVNPVRLASAVLSESPHVMLVGSGAETFADRLGLARVDDPKTYYRPSTVLTRGRRAKSATGTLIHGTVGAVALDQAGRLAAATSTGGTFRKHPGRVGDTPIIGAGTWADDRVAVSCTGVGEFFIRVGAGRDLAARMAYQGCTLATAAEGVIDAVATAGGDGGLIAVDALGNLAMPFNSGGMKRGYVRPGAEPVVEVY